MDDSNKFDGIDYMNTFACRIRVMHELVREVLSGQIENGYSIIDIGGARVSGPRS
ncbi:MAG: hypothetical protein M8349_01260 [ANME-2 cluster archaeon]|nr:hypothetical protein [ANME-2 cluster archaeon]